MTVIRKFIPAVLLALIGWAWCGALMALGPIWLPMQTTLILHAVLGPAGFALLSLMYRRRSGQLSPLKTALVYIGVVIVMDAGLVAPVFNKSYEMFRSPLGTWIPFLLIFGISWMTGILILKRQNPA